MVQTRLFRDLRRPDSETLPHALAWRAVRIQPMVFEMAGAWTGYHALVQGTKARLLVTELPGLPDINDLKLGDSSGGVALWIGPERESFKRLTI